MTCLPHSAASIAAVIPLSPVCGVHAAFTNPEKTALATYLTDGAGPIDLVDDDYRNRKLNGLFALVLESPAYQLV